MAGTSSKPLNYEVIHKPRISEGTVIPERKAKKSVPECRRGQDSGRRSRLCGRDVQAETQDWVEVNPRNRLNGFPSNEVCKGLGVQRGLERPGNRKQVQVSGEGC